MIYTVIYYIHYNNFSMIFIIAMESLFILLLLFTLSMRKWSFRKKKLKHSSSNMLPSREVVIIVPEMPHTSDLCYPQVAGSSHLYVTY